MAYEEMSANESVTASNEDKKPCAKSKLLDSYLFAPTYPYFPQRFNNVYICMIDFFLHFPKANNLN